MSTNPTLAELEADLGDKIRQYRLNKNLDQKTLAARAGISVRAVRSLEAGQGSTLKTLLSVIRALGRESWLQAIAPVATVNPLTLTRRDTQRLRATGTRRKRANIHPNDAPELGANDEASASTVMTDSKRGI